MNSQLISHQHERRVSHVAYQHDSKTAFAKEAHRCRKPRHAALSQLLLVCALILNRVPSLPSMRAMLSIILYYAFSSRVITAASERPNFVFIFLDDLRLDDMVAMPKIKEHITDHGANVTNFFVNTPVCCPSRATLLSGRYPHNLRKKVTDVTVPCCMHMDLLFGPVANASSPPAEGATCSNPNFWQHTWNVHIQNSGYNTGIFGKAYHMGSDAPWYYSHRSLSHFSPATHSLYSLIFQRICGKWLWPKKRHCTY